MKIQKYLFDAISKKVSKPFRMVDAVAEMLNLSSDAVYRRIRGEVELSVTELSILCRGFNLSFDELLNRETCNSVLFQYNSFDFTANSDYLFNLRQVTKLLKDTKYAATKELIFSVRYVPFWHCSNQKELSRFLLYAWYGVIREEKTGFEDFVDQLNFDELNAIYEQMLEAYNELPTKEIWTERTLDHILQLLEYYWKIGAFRDGNIVLTILEQLIRIVDRIESFAESGFKDKAKEIPFQLYICPIDILDNYILVRNDEKYTLGARLFSFNTIITDNPALCQEARNWFYSIMGNSNMISSVSAVERHLFFKNAINKIMEKEKIIGI